LFVAVTLNVGSGLRVIATGTAQMLVFALMQAFSVTVVGVVLALVPEVGGPVIVVVAEVSVPDAALVGEAVNVQVSPVALPAF
jgi:hypothetical protein